ncbi:MAG: twin-arginine translocation signal domain-containing protein [Thermodesulfovibrionia bacterium]|nr:twin-arginine translocation signal domain-containing protein [Thermodesulfovibrionia bacterium]
MEKLKIGRRSFLKLAGTVGLTVIANDVFAATKILKPV